MSVAVRILIADDQQLVRQSFKALLKNENVEFVGEAEDGVAAVEVARMTSPDVVLMDLSMPSLDGIEATRRIKRALPTVRVLMLSVAKNERHVAEAFGAGADGYALKWLGQEELMTAINMVIAGRRYLAPSLNEELVIEYLDARSSEVATLTAREREVLTLIALGLKNREIASALSIAVKTVETHRTKIIQKLDLHNSAELATYAIRGGLIE